MKRFTLLFATLLLLAPACDKAEDNKAADKKAKTDAKTEVEGIKAEPAGPPALGAGPGGTVVTDGQGKVVTDGSGNAVVTDGKGNTIKTDAAGAVEVEAADGTSVKVDKDGNVQIDGVPQ